MSVAEIISELPRLTREQREAIASRIAEMDNSLWIDGTVTLEERAEIDRRLAEIREGKASWSTWDDAKVRIAGNLRAS
jgi:hypothetical protein